MEEIEDLIDESFAVMTTIAGSAMLSVSIALNAVSVHGTCTAAFVAIAAILGFAMGSIQTHRHWDNGSTRHPTGVDNIGSTSPIAACEHDGTSFGWHTSRATATFRGHHTRSKTVP